MAGTAYPETLDAGSMRYRVSIMAPSPADSLPDSFGQQTKDGTAIADGVPANVESFGGDELWYAGQTTPVMDYRVTIRWRPGMTTANWFLFRGQRLDIVSISGEALRIKLVCMCKYKG